MSKPVKEMVLSDYQTRFKGVEGALVVEIRGIDALENNQLRKGLQQKKIRVTVVKNTLARKAFTGTALEPLGSILVGPSALATVSDGSVVDVARELVEWAKKIKNLTLKGAVLDGQLFEGKKGVEELSKFPTKVEAQAKVVQLFLSPARNIVGAAKSPGAKVLGIVKEIQERLEKGQAIAKVV